MSWHVPCLHHLAHPLHSSVPTLNQPCPDMLPATTIHSNCAAWHPTVVYFCSTEGGSLVYILSTKEFFYGNFYFFFFLLRCPHLSACLWLPTSPLCSVVLLPHLLILFQTESEISPSLCFTSHLKQPGLSLINHWCNYIKYYRSVFCRRLPLQFSGAYQFTSSCPVCITQLSLSARQLTNINWRNSNL